MLEPARDRVGTGFELLVEGHGRWDINMAIRICRAVEPLGVLWVEDICQPDSAEDLARLVRETRVPQAVSERLITRFPFREILRHQAAHVVLVDVAWTGGISEAGGWPSLPRLITCRSPRTTAPGRSPRWPTFTSRYAQPNCIGVEVVRGFVDGYYRDVLDSPLDLVKAASPPRPGPGWAPHCSGFPARDDVEVRAST